MKIRALTCLIGLALPAGAAAGQDGAPASTMVFNCLWRYRPFLDHEQYRLVVVEPADPGKLAKLTGTSKLTVRVLSDIKNPAEKPAPKEVTLQVSVNANRQLAPDVGKKYYLALLRRHQIGGDRTLWYPMTFYNLPPPGKRTTVLKQYYLLGIDSPDAALTRAIRELVLSRGPAGKPADKFARMMEHIGGPDKPARDFAISFAAVNGWGFSGSDDQQAQPDAFARMLLGVADPEARRLMAEAYTNAGADLLPRDAKLLERLFRHEDAETVRPVLGGNLRCGVKRAETLLPLIQEALGSPGPSGKTRQFVLEGLTTWGESAPALRPALEAIARGQPARKPRHRERLLALHLLMDWGGGEEIVLATLVEVPSAVVLRHAAERKVHAVVPAAIRAARGKKLIWSDAHSAAASLLARRFPDGDFETFDRWWSDMEKAGRAEEVLRDGLSDAELLARARQLIARIGSSAYREREAARGALAKLGLAALPVLQQATKHADPEIAVSAEKLIESAEAEFAGAQKRLDKAAADERSGKAFLPLPGEESTTQATRPAADAGPKRADANANAGRW